MGVLLLTMMTVSVSQVHSNITYVCSSVCTCVHVYTYIYTVHTPVFTSTQYAHVLFAYYHVQVCRECSAPRAYNTLRFIFILCYSKNVCSAIMYIRMQC